MSNVRKFVVTFERPTTWRGTLRVPEGWDEMSEEEQYEFIDEEIDMMADTFIEIDDFWEVKKEGS